MDSTEEVNEIFASIPDQHNPELIEGLRQAEARRHREWLIECARRPGPFAERGFYQPAVPRTACAAAHALAASEPRSMFLCGPTGTGKTSVACAWATRFMFTRNSLLGIFYLDERVVARAVETGGIEDLLRLFRVAEFLILDEFGDGDNADVADAKGYNAGRVHSGVAELLNVLYIRKFRPNPPIVLVLSNRSVADCGLNGPTMRRLEVVVGESVRLQVGR